MEGKLQNLRLDPKQFRSKQIAETEVSESWEDEELETPIEAPGPSLKQVTSNDVGTRPPPPTPISPKQFEYEWPTQSLAGELKLRSVNSSGTVTPRSDGDADSKRPEKTTAVAGRMIAAGLGMKVPKKTEEQRQYDRAMKEQEIKRKNREKEEQSRAKADDDKAKAAVWDS